VQAAIVAAALLLLYRESLLGYLGDQHYQEHFVYLWIFLGLALCRSLKGPFRGRFAFAAWRDRVGLLIALLAYLLMAASTLGGSSTGMRTSLVLFVTGCAVLAVPLWSVKRCLMHGLLMQLCFGIPYSVYFPLTSQLQWGVASAIAIPARLGLANYRVEAAVVLFPHYELVITPDCAGLGQLLTFVGIAALGVFGSARNRKRTILVFTLAVALAWLSNLFRVGLFVFLVAMGWTQSVDNGAWHAFLGFLTYMPFVTLLVAVLLRTHVPPPNRLARAMDSGRLPMTYLLLPLIGAHFWFARAANEETEAPSYFSALLTPPGHRLVEHSPSEEADRLAYGTPWLINARFQGDGEQWFDLLHYTTESYSHLCVHNVAACMYVPGQHVVYAAPVTIDGRPWWPISIDRQDPTDSVHVYFAFEIGDGRFDDSIGTQWEVFRKRLLGRAGGVRLTRVVIPGHLPSTPGEYELGLLTWLGRLTARGR
jgi:exosortase/archaeosortase family protein